MPRDQAPVLPSQIAVKFDPEPCGGLGYDQLTSFYSRTNNLSDSGLTYASGSGSLLGITDSAHAVYTPNGGAQNAGTLQALALLLSRDYWGWLLAAYDRALSGVTVPAPDATPAAVRWSYHAEGASTRMATEPSGGEVLRMGHADPASDCDARPKLYGGSKTAGVANGVLSLPRVKLAIVDGALRWFNIDPDPITICPTTVQPAGMTTEDGTMLATE